MDDVIPIRKAEVFFTAGGLVDRCHATLGIYGVDLDPDEATTLLGTRTTDNPRSLQRT